MWCSRPHNSGETSLILLFSSLWVTHPVGMGFDFIVIAHLLPSCCGLFFVFAHGISFLGGFQCPPLDSCSKASFNFGAFTGRNEYTSFYSTILTFWLSAFRMWGSKGHQDPNCETQAQHPCMWVFRRSFTSLFTQLWSVNLHLAWQQGLLPTEVNSTVIQAYALTWRVMLKKLWLNGSMKTCKNF